MDEREHLNDRHLQSEQDARQPARTEGSTATSAAAEEARHQRVMASARRVARKHRDVFAALAK